jgi:hypothetical protein
MTSWDGTGCLVTLLLGCVATAPAQAPLVIISVAPSGPYADLTEVDLDGDGLLDLVFVLPGPPTSLETYLQKGDGTGFERGISLAFPKGVAAIALADLLPGPGHDVALLSARGVDVVGGDGDAAPVRWLEADLMFPVGFRGVPRHWGWGRDVNEDGHDDLLLPGLDRDLIALGGPEGRPKGSPKPLPHPVARQDLGRSRQGLLEHRRYRPRVEWARVLPGPPVPSWLEPHGLVALGLEGEEGFAPTPTVVFPLKPFSQEGLGLLSRTDVDLADLDGDGLADFLLTRTEARGGVVPERRTDLLIFLNRRKAPEATVPSQVILLPGVLSSGPDLLDLDGDGRLDLVLSTFAGDMKSELGRQILGRVRLDYHAYLGTGSSPPFPRSPTLTETDTLDLDTFETWDLRHRRLFGKDWTGDGRPDLVTVEVDEGKTTVRVRPATGSLSEGASEAFGEDGPSIGLADAALGYRQVSLGPGRPALRLRTAGGVAYVTPAR